MSHHFLKRITAATSLAALATAALAQGAGASMQPIDSPPPVTTGFCAEGIKAYWLAIDFYTELKDAGKKSDAKIVLKRIQSLDQTLEDYGCWPG